MGQVSRKFEVIEGGCELVAEKPIKQPINNLDKWLSVGDLVELTGRAQQAVQKAVAARRWYGEELIVKTVAGTRGNGGKTYLIHVDKLPPEFKERWYASHGIELHEKVDAETGEVRLVPEQAWQNVAGFQDRLWLARWRFDLIEDVLRLPRRSGQPRQPAQGTGREGASPSLGPAQGAHAPDALQLGLTRQTGSMG